MNDLTIHRIGDSDSRRERIAAAQQIVDELGMPPDCSWVHIRSRTAVGRSPETLLFDYEGLLRPPLLSDEWHWTMPQIWDPPPPGWEQWIGYRFDYFGCTMANPTQPANWPFWQLDAPPSVGGIPAVRALIGAPVQLWRQQAQHEGSPLYGEILWRPEWGERRGSIRGYVGPINGPGTLPTVEELRAAAEGLRLIEHTERQHRGGSIAGDRRLHETDTEFLADLDAAIIRLQRSTGYRVPKVDGVLTQMRTKATFQASATYVRDRVKGSTGLRLNQYIHRHADRLWQSWHPEH